jgi:outer membrane murein-binding lipoprotein Lpp
MRSTRTAASVFALSLSLLSLGGCESGHSAKWYMAHGDAMAAKVKECKANPDRLANDKDCQNAIEAFVTWARATGQK